MAQESQQVTSPKCQLATGGSLAQCERERERESDKEKAERGRRRDEEGGRKSTLRRRLPEGAQNAPSESKTPWARALDSGRAQGDEPKGTNRAQAHIFVDLNFADFCGFSPFPRKQSIWEMQIFAENR